jgi:hypothetical protein
MWSWTGDNGSNERQMIVRLLAACFVLFASGALAHAAAPLATGSSTYDIELLGPEGGMTGSLEATLELHCTAYKLGAKMKLDLPAMAGGNTVTVDMTQTEDGDTLTFDGVSELNGKTYESSAGKATRSEGKLSVELTRPSETTKTFDKDVVFPVQMIDEAIAAAKAGKTFVEYAFFDGSGTGLDVTSVSVVIKPIDRATDTGEDALLAADFGFGELDRWQMTFAYFPQTSSGEGEQTPMFSTGMVVYENGFTLAASYDLGFGSMKLRLVEFKPIPPVPC